MLNLLKHLFRWKMAIITINDVQWFNLCFRSFINFHVRDEWDSAKKKKNWDNEKPNQFKSTDVVFFCQFFFVNFVNSYSVLRYKLRNPHHTFCLIKNIFIKAQLVRLGEYSNYYINKCFSTSYWIIASFNFETCYNCDLVCLYAA